MLPSGTLEHKTLDQFENGLTFVSSQYIGRYKVTAASQILFLQKLSS